MNTVLTAAGRMFSGMRACLDPSRYSFDILSRDAFPEVNLYQDELLAAAAHSVQTAASGNLAQKLNEKASLACKGTIQPCRKIAYMLDGLPAVLGYAFAKPTGLRFPLRSFRASISFPYSLAGAEVQVSSHSLRPG